VRIDFENGFWSLEIGKYGFSLNKKIFARWGGGVIFIKNISEKRKQPRAARDVYTRASRGGYNIIVRDIVVRTSEGL